MDIFVELHYHQCDDPYYGYNESFIRVYETFEKAKESVDSFLTKMQTSGFQYDGKKGNPFIIIVKTKMGKSDHETVYHSRGK